MKRMKERLDGQQIHKVRFVADCFVQALECQIEISHADRGESSRQWSDVLANRKLMQPRDAFFGSRTAAFLSMCCGKEANIQWRNRRRETLYRRIVSLQPELQEPLIESRFGIVTIQFERLSEMLFG